MRLVCKLDVRTTKTVAKHHSGPHSAAAYGLGRSSEDEECAKVG